MILGQGGQHFDYITRRTQDTPEQRSTHSLDDFPDEFKKKVILLKYFHRTLVSDCFIKAQEGAISYGHSRLVAMSPSRLARTYCDDDLANELGVCLTDDCREPCVDAGVIVLSTRNTRDCFPELIGMVSVISNIDADFGVKIKASPYWLNFSDIKLQASREVASDQMFDGVAPTGGSGNPSDPTQEKTLAEQTYLSVATMAGETEQVPTANMRIISDVKIFLSSVLCYPAAYLTLLKDGWVLRDSDVVPSHESTVVQLSNGKNLRNKDCIFVMKMELPYVRKVSHARNYDAFWLSDNGFHIVFDDDSEIVLSKERFSATCVNVEGHVSSVPLQGCLGTSNEFISSKLACAKRIIDNWQIYPRSANVGGA